jgi:uncharacterized protein YbjQ (UPF0145 family)
MGGLPLAARQRVERQRASGVTGSFLSAPAAASVKSAGLIPVGEVFGCLVMNLGWSGSGCAWWSSGGGGFLSGWGTSPVTTSGSGDQRTSFAPYVRGFEAAWHGAVDRMLAEARELGAHGVVGVRMGRARLDGAAWEFTALGTAVSSSDPDLVPFPTEAGHVWCTSLSAEDCASAILSGYLPYEMVLGISVSTKHEDMELKQQRASWTNTEVTGMTYLIQAARDESRARIEASATHTGGAELVITQMDLSEFETQCGMQDGRDLHAESVVVGTTLIPLPNFHRRAETSRVLTVLPLRDLAARGGR